MMKLNLKDVTLFGLDTNHHHLLRKAANVCQSYAEFGHVVLLSDKDVTINNIYEYNKFVMCNLHKYIETDYVLTIHHDGFILNPLAWTDDFYNYDYIGAPWPDGTVGNSGFNLKTRSLVNRLPSLLPEGTPLADYFPDDLIICKRFRPILEAEGFKFADEHTGHRFSHEYNMRHGMIWQGSFGFHDFKTNINNWTNIDKFKAGLYDKNTI